MRCRPRVCLGLSAALTAFAAFVFSASAAEEKLPNFILIFADDQSAIFGASNALLDEVEQGVMEQLAAAGYKDGERLAIRRFSAEGDLSTANAIAKQVADGSFHMAITISTLSLQCVANANKDGGAIHVFGGVSDPAGAGVGIRQMNSTNKPPWLAGIGTFQIFQETYHPEAYKLYHLGGKKSDYNYRLTSLDRAMEAGIDDVGIGALFGLYSWKYEVMALVRHTNHLEACYNVGPHTISFPRIKDANNLKLGDKYFVSDEDFARLIAILRLAVPYTGMILTAREPVALRNELLQFGVSQIDGGTKLELGSYASVEEIPQDLRREQFRINDSRSLGEIVEELLEQDMLPSFCTSCYRMGRTGEHFMEFSVPGFIKRFCTPNAILTLAEYLTDYANPGIADKGWLVIRKNMETLEPKMQEQLKERLEQIKEDPEVRVVIFSGAGEKAFSSGADLEDLVHSQGGRSRRSDLLRRLWPR